jgi:hypothetical protein
VKEKQWQNHGIILCMDVNEAIGEDSAGLSKLIQDCRLTDLLDIPDLNSDVSCIQRTSLVMLDNDASVL